MVIHTSSLLTYSNRHPEGFYVAVLGFARQRRRENGSQPSLMPFTSKAEKVSEPLLYAARSPHAKSFDHSWLSKGKVSSGDAMFDEAFNQTCFYSEHSWLYSPLICGFRETFVHTLCNVATTQQAAHSLYRPYQKDEAPLTS